MTFVEWLDLADHLNTFTGRLLAGCVIAFSICFVVTAVGLAYYVSSNFLYKHGFKTTGRKLPHYRMGKSRFIIVFADGKISHKDTYWYHSHFLYVTRNLKRGARILALEHYEAVKESLTKGTNS